MSIEFNPSSVKRMKMGENGIFVPFNSHIRSSPFIWIQGLSRHSTFNFTFTRDIEHCPDYYPCRLCMNQTRIREKNIGRTAEWAEINFIVDANETSTQQGWINFLDNFAIYSIAVGNQLHVKIQYKHDGVLIVRDIVNKTTSPDIRKICQIKVMRTDLHPLDFVFPGLNSLPWGVFNQVANAPADLLNGITNRNDQGLLIIRDWLEERNKPFDQIVHMVNKTGHYKPKKKNPYAGLIASRVNRFLGQ